MHFDLADLRLIAAIANTGSLSKAAASVPVAISAASNRLRLFEERCGVALFARRSDGMTLTPTGRLVLEASQRVLREAQQLDDTLRDQALTTTGSPRRLLAKGEGKPIALLDWQGQLWKALMQMPQLMREEGRGRRRWWKGSSG